MTPCRTYSGCELPRVATCHWVSYTNKGFLIELLLKEYYFKDRVSVLEDRSLRLERVTIADEGEYSCEADNVVGAITAMGTLTVYGKLLFVRSHYPIIDNR